MHDWSCPLYAEHHDVLFTVKEVNKMQIPGNPLMLPYTISQTLPTNRLLK